VHYPYLGEIKKKFSYFICLSLLLLYALPSEKTQTKYKTKELFTLRERESNVVEDSDFRGIMDKNEENK
jgi:hypothetical protein